MAIEGDIVYHPDDDRDPEGYALIPVPRDPSKIKKYGHNRDAEAARLKALGYTLTEICEVLELGPDTRRAQAAIRRALANMVRFAQDEVRMMEMVSLDELESTAWRTLRNNHVIVSNGRVVHDETGEPLQDDRFVLECIDRILKIKERRARMLGIDAPSRAEVISIDSIDSEIAKLERELQESRNQLPGKTADAEKE